MEAMLRAGMWEGVQTAMPSQSKSLFLNFHLLTNLEALQSLYFLWRLRHIAMTEH